jgi:hypothetical protein
MGKFPRKKKGFIVSDVDYDNDEVFETELEAEESVTVDVQEVERWECVDCGEAYEDKDEAYHCCE